MENEGIRWKEKWEQEASRRQLAEKDLAEKRLVISHLKKRLEDTQETGPGMEYAIRVFQHWLVRCQPKAKVFRGKRAKAVLDRLAELTTRPPIGGEPLTPEQAVRLLCHAVDGAAESPTIRDGRVYNDLELICRDASKVEDYARRADAAERRRNHGKTCDHRLAYYLEQTGLAGAYDPVMEMFRFACPCCLAEWHEDDQRLEQLGLGIRPVVRTLLIAPAGGSDEVFCESCHSTASSVMRGIRALRALGLQPLQSAGAA